MTTEQRSSPALLTVTWLLVILPTLWGLSYTVRNAMKLFAPQPVMTTPGSTTPGNATR